MMDLNTILLAVISSLLVIIGWGLQRYVHKDDEWKRHVDQKLNELAKIREICLREFAPKQDMGESFARLHEHQGKIAALEASVPRPRSPRSKAREA